MNTFWNNITMLCASLIVINHLIHVAPIIVLWPSISFRMISRSLQL